MNSTLQFTLRLLALALAFTVSGTSASAQFPIDRLQPVFAGVQYEASAVAIDGDTAVVGRPGATVNGVSSGVAFIFRRVAGLWSQESVLLPSNPQQGGNFGQAVAVSGSRAFVVDLAYNGNLRGVVHVFRRTGTFPFASWNQVQQLNASDPADGQRFGNSIAVDGNTLLVGCAGPGAQGWASYFFELQNGSWVLSERLPVPPGFGFSVAMSGDKAAISKTQYTAPYGEVRVWGRSPSGWQLEASLVPAPGENDDSFGSSIALCDGLLAIGQRYYRPAAFNTVQGRILLSKSAGSTWSNLVSLDWTVELPGGNVGASVATNGEDVVAHVPFTYLGSTRGALAVARWRSQDALPSKLGVIRPPTNIQEYWDSPALAIDGNTALLGGGVVPIISLVPPPPASYCTGKVNSAGCVGTISAVGSASATANSPFEVRAASVLNNKNGLLFFGTNGRTAFPFQGGFLCVLPPTRRTTSQFSGGSSGASNCSGSYVYNFNTLIQSGAHPDLVPGVMVNAQYWYRDPASTSTTGLTNALEFGIGF